MFIRLNKRGQNTAEYAIVISLVIAAAIAMQTYFKRGWQGGVKYSVDRLKSGDAGTGQYEPYYLESGYDVTTNAYESTEQTEIGGKVTRRTTGVGGAGEQITSRSGQQTIKDTSAIPQGE